MKRTLSVILVLCLIISMSRTTLVSGQIITTPLFQSTGVSMSATDFKNTYSGKPSSRNMLSSTKPLSTPSIAISNILINDDNISFETLLTINKKKTILPVKGTLSSSYKSQRGINSTIIEIPDTICGYEFLLFEIFNDTQKDNLLTIGQNRESLLSTAPHLKIYLKDQEDNIFLFETAMPDVFANFDSSKFKKANKQKDALWANNLVKHETTELQTNDSILKNLGLGMHTMGLDKWTTWVNPTTYYDSFYIGSDYYRCWSLPYVDYRHANVKSQDTTWAASFKVAEHMSVAGYNYYGNNVFEYRNLKISFACGDKSTFIRTFQEGRVYDYTAIFPATLGVGKSIAASLLKKVVNTLPYGSTFLTVLDYIKSMSSANGNVTLGSTGVSLSNQLITAIGEKLTKYSFEECTDHGGSINNGHYFTYQGVLQYENSSGNTNTVGALLVEFDKYYTGDSSLTPVSKSIQLNYSAQP